MQEIDIHELLNRVKNKTASEEEITYLESWYLQLGEEEKTDLSVEDFDEARDQVWKHLSSLQHNRKSGSVWPQFAAAACLLISFAVGGYFLMKNTGLPTKPLAMQQSTISAGINQATLTLANGKKIVLTKGLTGQLAVQGSSAVSISSSNAIVYEQNDIIRPGAIVYNILTTKKGEQSPFPLVLPDGSKVWLNAASSISFPTSFSGIDRTVKVEGEAYFEVIHDQIHPFRVISGAQVIEDIGTAFNVNAYNDEPTIKTTLIEGCVKVSYLGQKKFLVPGQQTNVRKDTIGGIKVTIVDADAAVAWRNNKFTFERLPIEDIMRLISRWYNVKIVFEGPVPEGTFWGSVSRYDNIFKVLNVLQSTGEVQFRIEGRTIYVSK